MAICGHPTDAWAQSVDAFDRELEHTIRSTVLSFHSKRSRFSLHSDSPHHGSSSCESSHRESLHRESPLHYEFFRCDSSPATLFIRVQLQASPPNRADDLLVIVFVPLSFRSAKSFLVTDRGDVYRAGLNIFADICRSLLQIATLNRWFECIRSDAFNDSLRLHSSSVLFGSSLVDLLRSISLGSSSLVSSNSSPFTRCHNELRVSTWDSLPSLP